MKNDMNELQQREMLIRSLGVFELRALARELGIVSPTTKRREELLSLIFDILKNGGQVQSASQKRGRPYKQLSSLENIVSCMQNDNREASTMTGVAVFMQGDGSLNTYCGDELIMEGYVRLLKDGDYCIFDYSAWSHATIPQNMRCAELLTIGAHIKIQAVYESKKCRYSAVTILQINGIDADEYLRPKLDLGDEVISKQEISFGDLVAKEGRRNIYSFVDPLFEDDRTEMLQKFCKENGYKFMVLSVDTPQENQIMFKTLNIPATFIHNYGENEVDGVNKIVDFINYCDFSINQSKKVVALVPDVVSTMKILDAYFVKSEPAQQERVVQVGHADNTIILMQSLFSLGRAYQSGCSGTLIMGYNQLDKEEKFLNSDILKISKTIN